MNKLKQKLKPYILLFPVLIILATIFVAGIIMAIIQSLGYFKAVGLTKFTLKYYKEVLGAESFLSSLAFSLYTSFTSSIISIILGVILAYCIYKINSKKQIANYLYKLPIIVPHIVSVLLVYNILSNAGILPRLLYQIGLIKDVSQFTPILYDKNGVGVIGAYVWKEIPFVALATHTILSKISDEFLDAARSLGANSRQAFFHIILPLITPSILSSFIIIFAFSFGAYEVPLLLGPTQPKALAVQAFVEYNNPVFKNRPYAMVINVLITLISSVLTILYYRIFEKAYKDNR